MCNSLGLWEFLFKESNTFIQQGCIKLIQCNSKDIHNVTKKLYYKEMLFFWTFCSSKNHSFHTNMKQHNCFQHW